MTIHPVPEVARRIATLLALLAILSVTTARADSAGSAPRKTDQVRAMFDGSEAADTIGLTPIWSLVVSDSGRRAEVVTNRFRDPTFDLRFPVDSVELRYDKIHGRTKAEPEMVFDAGISRVRISENGELDNPELHWVHPPWDSEPEPRELAGSGQIPRDGSQYCLSRDGKFLLVLRLMPHRVNVRGETGYFGLFDYFDVSNPKRPRQIGMTLEADGPLHNGVVSDDGSRVAVEILVPHGSTGVWSGKKVVAFRRTGRSISAPRVIVPATTAVGLQFEGRCLFVGMQRPPLPVFVQFSTTETITLYDLGP